MDVATHLVQAYLRLNGYLTAAEYPLIENRQDEAPRMLTDLDMLAVRFGRGKAREKTEAGRQVRGPVTDAPDPALACPPDGTDMIVAEIKQGRAFANPATRDPLVLGAALARFGCCLPEEAPGLVRALLQRGRAQSTLGHSVRMVLFASRGERAPRGWHWVHLDHVIRFADEFLRRGKGRFGHVDEREPALAWLSLLEKCGFTLEHRGSE
ncbi:MAG: hypothetical protein CMQ43_03285 [Gammaproteobacteria bacterium]|nr:hypothetical protein [Gammaproteobacteria bacterium]|tara:strand:+ start:5898 stop:6527 length:630 start_codon:yes stop_codon:yes gene_type:complete